VRMTDAWKMSPTKYPPLSMYVRTTACMVHVDMSLYKCSQMLFTCCHTDVIVVLSMIVYALGGSVHPHLSEPSPYLSEPNPHVSLSILIEAFR
jgi:hypothetical protein